MKLRQVLKRKVYPTWVSTSRMKGCKAYIFYLPRENYYHFQIERNSDIIYISLTEGVKFNNFDECAEAVQEWIRSKVFL